MSSLEDDDEFKPIIVLIVDGVRREFTPAEWLAWSKSDGGSKAESSKDNPHNQ